MAQMLAKSLKAHERKGIATSGSAKKVRVEETDPVVLRLDRPEPTLVVHLRPRVLPDPAERGSGRRTGRRSQVLKAILEDGWNREFEV